MSIILTATGNHDGLPEYIVTCYAYYVVGFGELN